MTVKDLITQLLERRMDSEVYIDTTDDTIAISDVTVDGCYSPNVLLCPEMKLSLDSDTQSLQSELDEAQSKVEDLKIELEVTREEIKKIQRQLDNGILSAV